MFRFTRHSNSILTKKTLITRRISSSSSSYHYYHYYCCCCILRLPQHRQQQQALLSSATTTAAATNECSDGVVLHFPSNDPLSIKHARMTSKTMDRPLSYTKTVALYRDHHQQQQVQLQLQQQRQWLQLQYQQLQLQQLQLHRQYHTSLVRCTEKEDKANNDNDNDKNESEAAAAAVVADAEKSSKQEKDKEEEKSEEPKKETPPVDALEAETDQKTSAAKAAATMAPSLSDENPSTQPHQQQQQQQQASPPPEAAAASEEEQQQQPPKQYSTPELTNDAAAHKAGLNDPDVPDWQNPLLHQNPDHRIYREDFDSPEEFEAAVVPAPPLQTSSSSLENDKPPTPEYLEALADEIVNLTVLEMNELINKMADHFGFHEGMLSPDDDDELEMSGDDAGADQEGGGAAAAPVEEKTTFDVKLTGFDAKAKIKVIKEVRAIAALGLKEAKDLVESAPATIQKEIKKEQAEEIKAKLEEVGATVEIV